MRLKSLGIIAAGCSALLFLAMGPLTAADAPAVVTAPDTIKMESKIYKKHTKGVVTFSHKKHAEHKGVSCTDCHHVYKDGKNTWKQGDPVQKCDACHTETGKPPKEMAKKDVIAKYHKEAVHENCKSCHKKMVDKNSDMGKALKACTGCHPKK
ncbi:Cytochrome c, class III [uncultured Desulfobacterium sp.]|uniref:Cytochrome c, class III n=1 Tax=uncultured Desulfobacterium sp. TaxID=201089 RepID=A0A445MXQ2_9BACT|nr:Cytochrome c, class III [uncultured Desulfobacterium sp.]